MLVVLLTSSGCSFLDGTKDMQRTCSVNELVTAINGELLCLFWNETLLQDPGCKALTNYTRAS